VHVGVFPISIDVARYDALASSPENVALASRLRERYARKGRQIGVSVDRIDYTKGIPERLQALELLWTESPELRERFTVVLIATPSRSEVPAYRNLECEIVSSVLRVNERFGNDDWTPIVLIHHNVDAEQLAAVYRAADFCIVSSLQDGMNLVSKEFIACQIDERGTLILSRFAGAAEEIDGAILINPFNREGVADGIRRALSVAPAERTQRMQRMRSQLRESTIFDWLTAILARAAALTPAEAAR
jgi:trehalose 6-phosphate synthase